MVLIVVGMYWGLVGVLFMIRSKQTFCGNVLTDVPRGQQLCALTLEKDTRRVTSRSSHSAVLNTVCGSPQTHKVGKDVNVQCTFTTTY
jgi:hypothetical protein